MFEAVCGQEGVKRPIRGGHGGTSGHQGVVDGVGNGEGARERVNGSGV